MISRRAKRALFVVGFAFVIVLAGCITLAYLISREVPFDWGSASPLEAAAAKGKLRKYQEAFERGDRGYVRLSEVEVNSYLNSFRTNFSTNDIGGPVRLERIGINMNKTNFVLCSWASAKFLGLPLKFVVQRGFDIKQDGTNQWELPLEFIRVGDLEIPRGQWSWFEGTLRKLDAPLGPVFDWTTNIQAMMVTRNELNVHSEFRLYTYKPIPIADFH